MATLKGKSTRKTPKPVLQDWIELPKEILEIHSKGELFMDTMYINTSKYQSIEYSESKEPHEHLRALSAIVNRYNKQDIMSTWSIVIGSSSQYLRMLGINCS